MVSEEWIEMVLEQYNFKISQIHTALDGINGTYTTYSDIPDVHDFWTLRKSAQRNESRLYGILVIVTLRNIDNLTNLRPSFCLEVIANGIGVFPVPNTPHKEVLLMEEKARLFKKSLDLLHGDNMPEAINEKPC